jgi:hypothetical protein
MAKYRPWHPVKVNPHNNPVAISSEIRKCDAIALKAMSEGVANEGQQKMAYAAIMHICGTNDLAWMPDEHGGERDSSFAAGKQFVGHQLRKLVSFSISDLTGENHDGRSHDRRTGKPRDERNSGRAKQ